MFAPFGGVLGLTRFLVGFHYVLLGFQTYIAAHTHAHTHTHTPRTHIHTHTHTHFDIFRLYIKFVFVLMKYVFIYYVSIYMYSIT
jgi:hypothetical protein